MNINLKWLPSDEYRALKDANPYVNKYTRKPEIEMDWIKRLHEEYITPHDFLNNVDYIKFEITEYILVWAIKHKIFKNTSYKKQLFKALFRNVQIKKIVYLRWAYQFNFITVEDMDKIRKEFPGFNKAGVKTFILHLLYIDKPFGSLNEVEITAPFKDFPELKFKPYTQKMLQTILFNFNLSNGIVTRKSPQTNIDILSNHKSYGYIFAEYHKFLLANGTKDKMIGAAFSELKKFIIYLEQEEHSLIDEKVLKNYIVHQQTKRMKDSSIMVGFPKLQNFLDWACGHYEEFPNMITYPTGLLNNIRKSARRSREESDGLAYSNEEIAPSIVKFLKEFKPSNEVEFLCSKFWSVIASCAVRQSFVLNLEYNNCMHPLLNEKELFGLYSKDADKAGNKNGQFPIIDALGSEAIRSLEQRIAMNRDKFKPLKNSRSNRVFIHLFQYENASRVLERNAISKFAKTHMVPYLSDLNISIKSIGTHGFRHHLLTHIVRKTGSEAAAQAAAGHHDGKMVRTAYIKSKHAKNALLHRAIDKFEGGEITGKFYLRLIEKLTDNSNLDSTMMKDLETEMELEEFIKKHGRSTEMGYCFDEDHTCNHYMKCWNCPSFMLRREEVTGAIDLLRKLIVEFEVMKKNSKNFSFESTIAQNKLRAIAMIKERLSDLKYTDEQIEIMLLN